jgi:hypothetical protein
VSQGTGEADDQGFVDAISDGLDVDQETDQPA